MAEYVTVEGDRIDRVCALAYDVVSSAGMETILRANPHWRGQAVLEPGLRLEIPDEIEEIEYNTDDLLPDVIAIRDALDG